MADDNFRIKLEFRRHIGSVDKYDIVSNDGGVCTVEKKKKEPADLVVIKSLENTPFALVDNMSSNAVIRYQGLQVPISKWLSRDQNDSSYDLTFPHPGLPHLTSDHSKFKWAIDHKLFWVRLNDNTWEVSTVTSERGSCGMAKHTQLQYQCGIKPEKRARLNKDGNDSWVLGITVDAEDYQEQCIIFAALCLFKIKF